MITPEEIEKLSELARIKVPESEREKLANDVESILGYVGVISSIVGEEVVEAGEHRNIMREDGEPHKAGMYTDRLVDQLSKQDDNSLVVKKIIEQ
ncbi:MAG: aspartyl/glutamyl-tRNA amidotransferase subunit C [Parcubacteria group bacterium]|nr:aspartyl/glutamyl-tRNA amidotransferase subunit C [Parcubacteria group bacterium]